MTFEIRGLRRAGAHGLRALALAGGLLVAFSASDRGAMAQLFNQFPLSTPSSVPQGITLGPDGALWFTETLNNKIGRITTAGVITEYTIPVASSSPQGITSGPDGSLWFTMFAANADRKHYHRRYLWNFLYSPHVQQRIGGDHHRAGRCAVVHREQCRPDRKNHHIRRHHRIQHGHNAGRRPHGNHARPRR